MKPEILRSTGTGQALPESVNYHLNRACNYRCAHCYAVFAEEKSNGPGLPSMDERLRLVELIAAELLPSGASRRKLSFAGGEPTLLPGLHSLVRHAHAKALITMLISNGTRLDKEYLRAFDGTLNWLTLSIDSANDATNRAIGRATRDGKVITAEGYQSIANLCRDLNIRLKVNTVVNARNWTEDLRPLLRSIRPERWKILQVMKVAGQNDLGFPGAAVSLQEFGSFVDRHRELDLEGINIVPEEAELDIRGSYAMIDPQGRFFDSTRGLHFYSCPILKVGVQAAWNQIQFDRTRFEQRGGRYAF
jgi:radical S-adenosyl methionine domain-containing protein 2